MLRKYHCRGTRVVQDDPSVCRSSIQEIPQEIVQGVFGQLDSKEIAIARIHGKGRQERTMEAKVISEIGNSLSL